MSGYASSSSSDDDSVKSKGKKEEFQKGEYITQGNIQNVGGVNIPVLNLASLELPDPKVRLQFHHVRIHPLR